MFGNSQLAEIFEKRQLRSRLVFHSFVLIVMMLTLSACGLISSGPKSTEVTPEAEIEVLEAELEEAELEEAELEEVSADVAGIDKVALSKSHQLGNVALRLLTLEQGQAPTAQNNSTKQVHGYYWLDGIVKDIQISSANIKTVEVESVYDGERYIVTENIVNMNDTGLLDNLAVGEFVYLNGFYDTFSGFLAVKVSSEAELIEKAIVNSQGQIDKSFEFGTVTKTHKRRQSIEFTNGQDFSSDSFKSDSDNLNSVTLDNQTAYYRAYSKQEMTKNAFWRALSKDDSVFMISSGSGEALKVETVWLLDNQSNDSAVIGTIKEVNDAQSEIVLVSEMWQLKDGTKPNRQIAEVSLKLVRKSQVFSSDGQSLQGASSLETALVPGQQVIVEGIQKNRALEVERLYLKGDKQLPVYAYGTVSGHQQTNKTVDLTVEWMFGSEPSETLKVSISSFTELFEIGDEKTTLSSEQFWQWLSLNDEVEVEGQIIGNTLEARRLFLGNKKLDLQTLSGTVESISIADGQAAFRPYSYADDTYVITDSASLMQIEQELIELTLANDVDIQDIHLAESLAVEKFWVRLEPTDQLTVTGYFENSGFVATGVKFEDNDTTPFVFGEVEAFDPINKQIMLKGKNNVVLLNNKTTIKDTATGELAANRFWSKLTIGDNIDIEGSYQEGIFVAKKVFLSPKLKRNLNSLEGEILSFNIKTATLRVKETDGFIMNVALAKETILSETDKKLYSPADFWIDVSIGQQVIVTGERFGSIMQASTLTVDTSPAKKNSYGFFDWLNR